MVEGTTLEYRSYRVDAWGVDSLSIEQRYVKALEAGSNMFAGMDVNYVNALTAKKPTILVINYSNPFVIDEIYNDQTKNRFKGVIATFGVEPDALLDVVSGKFNPTGKMPFTTPVNNQAVEYNKEDVPGYDEGEGYGLFLFNEGLRYEKKK